MMKFSSHVHNKIRKAVLCGSLLALCMWQSGFTVLAETAEERIAAHEAIQIDTNQITNWPVGPVTGAEAAILMDADTGSILYSKNIHQKEYPASTTKILTCLIAAEQCNLSDLVTFSHSAVFDTPRDSNNIAIDEGEKLTVEECIQAILIRSANECAFALAEHISGTTWQDFAEIMNERAKELGCLNSNFVNPNGLPDDNHYTSAYDLACIGRAFFGSDYLCRISTSTALHIYPSAYQPDEIFERNATQLLEGKPYEYEYLVGCKTGYTLAAQSCLVSCAEKDGMKLICVVLNDASPRQYQDTIALFDYGFSNFESVCVADAETRYNISNTGSFYSQKDLFGNSKPILSLNRDARIIVPRTTDFASLESTISYDDVLPGTAAVISYSYHGQSLGTATVDFASETKGFSFEDPNAGSGALAEVPEEEPEEEKIVFVNVLRISIYVVSVLGTVIVIYLLIRWLRFYRKRHPNRRRNWRRDRKQNHPISYKRQLANNRREVFAAARRRKKGRRKIRRSNNKYNGL